MNRRTATGRGDTRSRGWSFAWRAVLLWALACQAGAGMMPGDPRVLQARQLIDASDGHREALPRAADLLAAALAEDPQSFDAHVEAARIAVKGGLVGNRFRPGALEAADRHLGLALAAFPDYAPALSLQGELRMLQGRMAEALAILQRARTVDPQNPWVRINLGRYLDLANEPARAHEEFRQVVRWGPQGRFDQALAYPHALAAFAEGLVSSDGYSLQQLAEQAERYRQPGTAYIPRTFARLFVQVGEFDEGIAYARKALALDSGFDGRQALANALYGKAAQLQVDGQDGGRVLVGEAEALQANPGLTLCAFTNVRSDVRARVLPAVRQLLPPPAGPARALYAQSGCPAARQG